MPAFGFDTSDLGFTRTSEGVRGVISHTPNYNPCERGLKRLRTDTLRELSPQKRSRLAGGLGIRIFAQHALPRGRGGGPLAKRGVRLADPQPRVGRRRRVRRGVDRLAVFEQRLAIVALAVIRLADPELRSRDERTRRIAADELGQLEHRLPVLSRAK